MRNQARGVMVGLWGAAVVLAGMAVAFGSDALSVHGESATERRFVGNAADVSLYRKHVVTLANPFFEGRGSGTRGNELAADYLEFYFKKAGLEPMFALFEIAEDGTEVLTPGSTYRQAFEVGREPVVREKSLVVDVRDGAAHEVAGADFEVLGVSGSGWFEGPVAFAGYAIEEGMLAGSEGEAGKRFSSFAEGDSLKGKAALVLRFEPMDSAGRSVMAESGGRWSNSAAMYPKVRAAAERGASAVILVSPPGADDPRVGTLETIATTQRLGRGLEVPVVMVSVDAADAMVRALDVGGRSLMDLRRLADAGGGIVELGQGEVRVGAEIDRITKRSENVGGILRGRGALASEYVVVGAHFDHVGDGRQGGRLASERGKIHPGADDNASGTAGLLLAVDRLCALYAGLGEDASVRSVIFLGFSGEEIGLIGSRHFVRNSPVPASSIYAMLNMDMIGRLTGGALEVSGTGTAEGFAAMLEPRFAASGMSVTARPGGRGPSDHAAFYGAGIPVLHFFTGIHPDYHTPADVSDLVNFDGGVQVADLVCEVAMMLAERDGPLVFKSGSSDQGADAGPTMGQMRVRFGVSPGSYAEGESGVPVGEVFPGTSAAEAGIKAGDRLMQWNGAEITDVSGWMVQMQRHRPGDEVDVTIRRGGEELVVRVKLKGRETGQR